MNNHKLRKISNEMMDNILSNEHKTYLCKGKFYINEKYNFCFIDFSF
jgi:hypothetical protein